MSDPLLVLTVCTANVCRSPVAERLLQREFDRHGIAAVVSSAGTIGGRLSVHRDTLRAAADHGVDLSDHRSRELTTDLIDGDGADLVVTMTRDHLYEVVAARPDAFARSFTLIELAHLARTRPVPADVVGLDGWLAALSVDRSTDRIVADDTLDLADPYGGPRRGHRDMVDTVERLTAEIVNGLAPHLPRT